MAGHADQRGMAIPAVGKDLRWAAALQTFLHKTAEVVPEGYYTVDQVAQKIGRSLMYAKHLVRVLDKNKAVEKRLFRVIWGRGVRLKPHYRLPDSTPKNKKSK